MDANYKRHGKKSDKETQSPVLKVFQDMMQKEKNDSEKSNLLKEKQDKKRRQYSGLRIKHNHHKQRGHESSSSDRQKRMNAIEYKDKEYAYYRTQSIPFQDEKKESWWFWGGEAEKKRSEDTCSCVSCALKKILSSEYTCMACLGVVFLLSVVAAFMLVFKTTPMAHPVESNKKSADYHHANAQADFIPGRYNDDRLEDGLGDSQTWSDIASRHLSGLAAMTGYTGDTNRDWSADEVGLNSDSQLSSVLDAEKINEGLNNDKLRSFYKKLLKTDAEICNLKKGSSDITETHTKSGKFDYISERKKRSLRFGHPKMRSDKTPAADQGINAFNLYYPPFIAINSTMKYGNKTKRDANSTEEPTGYVVEKKQVIVQFKSNPKKVPKCSHTPKDSIHKSHERQMKHPFYKHTQRLDELLDQLLDRSMPELMSDPFGVDTLFTKAKEEVSEKANHKVKADTDGYRESEKANHKIKADTDGYREILMNKIIDNKKEADANFLDILRPIELDTHLIFTPTTTKRRIKTTTTPHYNLLLSVSTVFNPSHKYVEKKQIRNVPQTAPNLRKLMQTDEENDESLGYEDVNEVLTDESETTDEKEEGKERRKRMKEDPIDLPSLPAHSALNLHNPNWKGPMPLYPDELISMIKQAAINNLPYNRLSKKMKVPGGKDNEDTDYFESSLNDMEYIENYSNKKNEGLVKMAQAYSDYGVLDEKKASLITEKNSVTARIENAKTLSKKKKLWRGNFFNRLKKNTIEGIRFEVLDEAPLDILKTIGKHVKFGVPESMGTLPSIGESNPPDFAFSTSIQRQYSYEPIKKAQDDGSTFTVHFTKAKPRRLLSIDETEEMIPEKNRENETAIAFEEADKSNISYPSDQDFLKAVLDLNVNNMKNSTQASNTDISDLFMMISSWFSALAASAFASNNNISLENNSKIMRMSMERRSPATILENSKYFELLYPNYNTEMIENIGHRSRVLLSVEDLKPDDAIDTTKKSRGVDEVSNNKKDNAEVLIVTTVPFSTLAFEQMSDNITSADLVLTTINEHNSDNKSIVKRNANEGSNLIFWNDIYDDEYGVKMDPLESSDNVGDKQIKTRGIGFVKKSGNWLQNKVRNIADNIKSVKTTTKKITPETESTCRRVLRSPKFYGVGGYPKYNKYKQYPKRSVNGEEGDTEKSNDFEELTKKMKEVCKEAAQAVQQTRNIKVIRRSEKDDVLSTSLMQQLVRLMTDVIDYKVREKTCLRLPLDLQEFLEWITSANSEKEKDSNLEWVTSEKDKYARSLKVGTSDEDIDQPIDPLPSSEKEDVHTDTRSDCLGTIYAVEDLMKQYDEMSEIDKIKMTGIREYLENQLQFLHKHLATYDDYKVLNYDQDRNIPYRFKRYAPNTKRNYKNRYIPNFCQERRRRYKRKFIKSFTRKRTKSTASIYDGGLTAELHKTNKPTRVRKDDEAKLNGDELNKVVNTQKRNLKDVYYKAIADAKKYTTFKTVHMKTEIDGFDNAKIVRIEK